MDPVSLAEVRAIVEIVLQPGHFFLPAGGLEPLEHHSAEEISWEIFQGRLLDASQTRERRVFEAWNLHWEDGQARSAEPLLAVKLDVESGCVHVLRAILCHTWEGYHAGDNVYLSRETRKWLRELVATIDLRSVRDRQGLRQTLVHAIFRAVVGTSRLPLLSLEAPLPAFTFGTLAYFFTSTNEPVPMVSYRDLTSRALTAERTELECVKLLETLLRATPAADLPVAADMFVKRWQALGHTLSKLPRLLRALFDEVALTPYTCFVDNLLEFVTLMRARGHLSLDEQVDFLGWLLGHLCRHLTAYDLVKFHHRGANYPDALLLDAALSVYLRLADLPESGFASSRLRRRALRQAILLRHHYEGHLVPDGPTSPGENTRVLPTEFPRVPEEQITDPTQRTRRLYEGTPLLPQLTERHWELLRQSIEDLQQPAEWRELGTALFLDRPLGIHQRSGEPDDTLLFSYVAFSPSVAERRAKELAQILASGGRKPTVLVHVMKQSTSGIPLQLTPVKSRPGVVSLNDAFQTADDFHLLRTTRRSVQDFLAVYDLAGLEQQVDLKFLTSDADVLIIPGAAVPGGKPGTMVIYDADFQPRLEFAITPSGELKMSFPPFPDASKQAKT